MLQELDILVISQPSEKTLNVATVRPEPVLPAQAEPTDLEIPKAIWFTMFACYAVFFFALLAATGRDTGAIFMIVISMLYALTYFGVAGLLFGQNMPTTRSLFAKGIGPLMTNTGPMDLTAVKGQILAIPFCLAFFGFSIAIFRSVIFE